MSLRTERKLLEWAKWFEYNKGTISDPMKRTEFLLDAVENFAHLLINQAEDIRILEGRGLIAEQFPNIIVPDGMLKKTPKADVIDEDEIDPPEDGGNGKLRAAEGTLITPRYNAEGKAIKP